MFRAAAVQKVPRMKKAGRNERSCSGQPYSPHDLAKRRYDLCLLFEFGGSLADKVKMKKGDTFTISLGLS